MFLDQSYVTPVTISQSLKNQFKKQAAPELEGDSRKGARASRRRRRRMRNGFSRRRFSLRAILKQATKSGCDLIMMASHGRSGMSGVLLGSETAKVLAHSKIQVLVVR